MLNLKFTEVKRFYYAAELHFDSAAALMKVFPSLGSSLRGHEIVYLAGYVVECSLKALYLSRCSARRHEEVVDWLKATIKHNLEKLKGELVKKGVAFPSEVMSHLKWVNTHWSSEMRYRVHTWSREDTTRFLKSVRSIRAWVQGGGGG